jgi:2-polyprenyl-6-hydroxyphenyl methylase/3-demethylubiquinone-9 3-methyltransferase
MPTANDLDLYERHAHEWWDTSAHAFRSLHATTEFRSAIVAEWLGAHLRGAVVLDLGCGGGLMSEPLVRAGARVFGCDIGRRSVAAATARLGACFAQADLRHVPFASACADVAVLADVIEHVREVERAVAEAARVLRPGGWLYVNTINRTRRARWLAVTLAEGVGLVPRGTHDADMFVTPDELTRAAELAGLRRERIQGESVALLRTVSRWAVTLRKSDDLSVSYSALFRKS